MQARPVRHYKAPAYPTRRQVLADPRLLQKHLPAGWKLIPPMAGIAAVMLAANACVTNNPWQSLASRPAIVAPIFLHGEGRGVIGCVVENPPAFLSEEEALDIIREELAAAGITTWSEDTTLPTVWVPERARPFDADSPPGGPKPLTARRLQVDMMDEEQHIAVEYVSLADYNALRTSGGAWSSVQEYNLPEVARDISHYVEEQGKDLYFGAFYDPVAERSWENSSSAPGSRELLRQQVQDFIEWLEGQGVLQ